MSTVYNGIPGNIAFVGATSIASSNANAITTSSPHGLITGDKVDVSGHQQNTAANGIWTITQTGASTFLLNGYVGSGIGAATGTVQPLTYGAATTLPSDGDPRNAASVNVPLITAMDRTALLMPATGAYKLAARVVAALAGAPTFTRPWCHIAAGAVTVGVPSQFTSDGLAWGVVAGSSTGVVLPTTVAVAPIFQFPVTAGDTVIVRLDTTVNFGIKARVALYSAFVLPGGSAPTWPGGYGLNAGATAPGDAISGTPVRSGVSVPLVFSAVANSGTLWIQPAFLPQSSSGSVSPELDDDATITVESWRPTGVPQ